MFHYIEPFVQWKVSTDDKVIYGSIDANKEPVFFLLYSLAANSTICPAIQVD